MTNELLDRDAIDGDAASFLRAAGHVFAVFDARTQDSGNVSYGVEVAGARFFVKTAGDPGDRSCVLDYAARAALLRNAVELARSCTHRCLPALRRVIESPAGPLLVYDWLPGELLGVPRAHRDDPASAFQRFRALPAAAIRRCVDEVFALHRALASAGWIASDFYDGCLIYDFAAAWLGVIDLDNYRRGAFTNDMGRMFGSTRFMAPEEHERGARIDERTTAFTLGRTALVLLADGTLEASAWRGTRVALDVVRRACEPDPVRRYPSVAALCDAWRVA